VRAEGIVGALPFCGGGPLAQAAERKATAWRPTFYFLAAGNARRLK